MLGKRLENIEKKSVILSVLSTSNKGLEELAPEKDRQKTCAENKNLNSVTFPGQETLGLFVLMVPCAYICLRGGKYQALALCTVNV